MLRDVFPDIVIGKMVELIPAGKAGVLP